MRYPLRRLVARGSINESRVLVVGATGQLGGAITRKLIASGTKVRALGRNQDARLKAIAERAVETGELVHEM